MKKGGQVLVRYCSAIAILAILAGGCNEPQPAQSTQPAQPAQSTQPAQLPPPASSTSGVATSVSIEKKEWYAGGNLSRASIGEWKAATYENKLATSADMVATLKKFSSMDEMKAAAVELEQCVSKVAEGPQAEQQRVNEVAAACAILLGYR
jgi:hypothetical protein